jgi:hypothetical protein
VPRQGGAFRDRHGGTNELDQTVSIAIDLVWDGVGREDRTSNHVTQNQGIFRLVFHSYGAIRDAAAAGSIALDGTDMTPLPSTQGTIEKDAVRELVVYR